MPAFEEEDIPKMKELMDEKAKADFLAKRKRLEEARKREIEELERMFEGDEDGIFSKMDGPEDLRD